MPCPVSDLRAFLLGTWRISRRIRDSSLDLSGRLAGCAIFTPAPGGLCYDETGLLRFGSHQGEATRQYLLSIDRQTAEIHHADGSPFHRLELSSGEADIVHRCADDLYHGRYRVLGADCWTVAWRVTGPRKRYSLVTRHTRIGIPSEIDDELRALRA
jgi:hypothetical protein